MPLDPDLRKELRDYAWKYFDRHAEQRLKTFNFYILLCGGIIAGLATVLREPGKEWLAVALASLSAIVSFVFWKLDNRTRFLIKHSEEALKFIEDDMADLGNEALNVPHRCKLFRREKHEQGKCGPAEYSYTTCFRWVFAIFGWGGAILAAYFAYKINNPQS